MDEQKPQGKQENESVRTDPEAQVEDLAPDGEEGDAIKGGSIPYGQIQYQYSHQNN